METRKKSDRHQGTPYPLRLPPELRQQLAAVAARNQRSLNGEIIYQLQSLQARAEHVNLGVQA